MWCLHDIENPSFFHLDSLLSSTEDFFLMIKCDCSGPAIMSASQGEWRHGLEIGHVVSAQITFTYNSSIKMYSLPHLSAQDAGKCSLVNQSRVGLKRRSYIIKGRRESWLLGYSQQSCLGDQTRSVGPCVELCLDKAYVSFECIPFCIHINDFTNFL